MLRCRPPAVAVLLALSAVGCSGDAAAPRVQRHHLLTLPETYRAKSLFISDDGAAAVYVIATPAGDRVVQDGVEGPPYAEIAPPRFAPQSRRAFYWALDRSGPRPAVVLSAAGERIRTGYARAGELRFSPDGTRWAALGGVEIDRGDDRRERGPVVMLVDGERREYRDASLPAFSVAGARLAYLAEEAGSGVALLVDGEVRRRFEPPPAGATVAIKVGTIGPDLPRQYAVRFLADDSLLTVATDAQGWAVFRDGRRLASYPINVADPRQGGVSVQFANQFRTAAGFMPSTLATAAAAPVAAWWMREAGDEAGWRVVRDGVPEPVACARPWEAEPPALSADGRHLAYACHRTPAGQPEQVEVVFDGRRFGPYLNIWAIALSPDGRRIAFGADDGAPERPWFYVVDGRRHGLQFDRVFPPRFSPDGRHVAWVAERSGRVVLFLDGDGYASSDDLLWAPTFDLGTGLSWAVLRGRRVSRVDVGPLR